MLTSKFDLYKNEWLELVFDDRNHEYGAYELRRHYSTTLVRAMAITFFTVGCLFIGYTWYLKYHHAEIVKVITYDSTIKLADYNKPIVPPKQIEKPQQQQQVKTTKYTEMVVKPDEVAEKPPVIDELKDSNPGPQNTQGKADDNTNVVPAGNGSGTAPVPNATEDNEPKSVIDIQVMPEPYGGAEAWSKFLQKNIHYPSTASENGVSGKVFLSFIIEKDGHLSNIVVERGVGYGLDEEAVRVLKKAPAWKPGIQNGHAVRVKFTMPISFQMTTE